MVVVMLINCSLISVGADKISSNALNIRIIQKTYDIEREFNVPEQESYSDF